jgi:hypothetical protein
LADNLFIIHMDQSSFERTMQWGNCRQETN